MDVVIAGGGPAGAALALLLGRAGYAVALYDRARFPREKPCGEGLMPAGVAALGRLLGAFEGAPFAGLRYYHRDVMAQGRFSARPGLPDSGLGLRRWRLDAALIAQARSLAGVQLHEGMPIDALLVEGGVVRGVRTRAGEQRARLTVIADGHASRLRGQLGLDGPPLGRRRVGLRMHVQLADGQRQPPWVEIFLGSGHELYLTPLPGGELLIAALAEQGALEGPAQACIWRWAQAQPVLAERLEGARQLTEVMGRAALGGRATSGGVPGALLLGDAYRAIDPIVGAGMTQALRSAELLAAALPDLLGREAQGLARFERARRRLYRSPALAAEALLFLGARPALAQRVLLALRRWPALFGGLLRIAGAGLAKREDGGISKERASYETI